MGMNVKCAAISGWFVCAVWFNSLAQPADLPGLWHAPKTSLAATHSTAAGNGIIVRVDGSCSTVLHSVNGTYWTRHSSGTPCFLYSVAFGHGRFVAVGNEGTILNSVDGVNWQPANSRTEERLRGIVFANDLFVAVGFNGTILTSKDGLTWKKRAVKTDDRLLAVNFGNDRFLAISKNGQIVSSTDGKHWKRAARINGTLAGLTYQDGAFVMATSDGATFTSCDGLVWIAAIPTTTLFTSAPAQLPRR